MFVIFWVESKKYYTQSKVAQSHWTTNIEKATKFKSLEAAQNMATNNIKVAPLEYIDYGNTIPLLTKEEVEAAYEELRQAVETFGEVAAKIPAIMQYYQNVHSEQDKVQEDLLHKFEFMEPNNILFIKFSRMLKNCRLKRREAKDRVDYMTAISQSSITDLLNTHKNHNKLIETRNYSPRIIPELFEKKDMNN